MSFLINDPVHAAVFSAVVNEVARTMTRPYPMSHLRRTALMCEEAGEALKEALNVTRDSHLKTEERTTAPRRYSESDFLRHLHVELIQTAAMAVRQLIAMEEENRARP